MLESLFCLLMVTTGDVLRKQNVQATLDGEWEQIAVITGDLCEINKDQSVKWIIKERKVVFRRTGQRQVIPRDGAEFDLEIDVATTPNRLTLSYHEQTNRIVFGYCIFDRSGDTLMVKMVSPLSLTDATEKAKESFSKNPYPSAFPVARRDGSMVIVFRLIKKGTK